MKPTEMDGFDAATVLRVKSRIRRQMRQTKNSIGLKKYQVEWLLDYIDRLETLHSSTPSESDYEKRLYAQLERIEGELNDLLSHDEMGGTARYLLGVLHGETRTMRECAGFPRAWELEALEAENAKLREFLGECWTFCPECGPGVQVDEDGLCVGCGATAVGTALDKLRAILGEEAGDE